VGKVGLNRTNHAFLTFWIFNMKPNVFVPLSFLFLLSTAQAATVTKTTITKTNVTPTSASAGTMFKFSATLNAPLTSGNKVKIDLGKGLATMTGTKTSYSLSRAIYTTGAQTYKVGVYNAKNVLQGKVSSGNFTVSSKITPTNNAPTLTLVSGSDSVEQYEDYTLQLKAIDIDNNLRSITVDWKDGSIAETQTATNDETLTFTHTYATAGKFELTAIAKDRGKPALTSTVLSKTIEVVAPPEGNYSKVCNSGALEGEEDCPINPVLGNKATDWACTKDNKTGLIWEIKTTDGGLRDWGKYYTNYTPDYDPKKLYEDETNASGFALDVNTQGLCGASDWRLPTKDELLGIVKKGNSPVIDTTYFPNTQNMFWSSSLSAGVSNFAWLVSFYYGGSDSGDKYGYINVRLVRDGK
jgi:hypothetical protein